MKEMDDLDALIYEMSSVYAGCDPGCVAIVATVAYIARRYGWREAKCMYRCYLRHGGLCDGF